MRYRLLCNLKWHGEQGSIGDLADFPDAEAEQLLAAGQIELAHKSFTKRFESGAAASKRLESTDPELGAALKQLCTARDSIVGEIKALDKKIGERHAARAKLLNDPVSKPEYMGFVKAELERRAANLSGPLNGAIASAPKGYGELSRALAKGPVSNMNYLTDRILPDRVTDAAICFYFGEAIIAKLTAVVDGMDWPDGSVPCAKRDELIALADSEINDLTCQRDELAASLTRVGMIG